MAWWAAAFFALLAGGAAAQAPAPSVKPAQAQREEKPSPGLPAQKLEDLRKALAEAPSDQIDDSSMSFAPGLVVPAKIALQDVPASAAAISPSVAKQKFFVGRADYFIVDPATRKITIIVPKNTGL